MKESSRGKEGGHSPENKVGSGSGQGILQGISRANHIASHRGADEQRVPSDSVLASSDRCASFMPKWFMTGNISSPQRRRKEKRGGRE